MENLTQQSNQGSALPTGFNLDAVLHGEAVEGSRNLDAITVYTSKISYMIEPNKDMPMKTRLVIDRRTGKITEETIQENEAKPQFPSKNYSALIGTVQVLDKFFLLLSTTVIQVGTIEQSEIYHPITIAFLPFDIEKDLLNSPNISIISQYIQNLRQLLVFGHYFSYTYDLTVSKQAKANGMALDPRFLWNKGLVKDFKKYKISSSWTLPLIQGYVGLFSAKIQGKELSYYLISRRSGIKAGTRYHARGIDDDGFVSNFVETEQIIYYDGLCCSHVQIRGSVPIFFQQRGITAATKINRSFHLSNQAFLKHFEDLSKSYGNTFCVNLLSKTKKEEQMLTEAFEIHVNNNHLDNMRYEFFDFHYHTKGGKFEKVNTLISKFHSVSQGFKFYSEDAQSKTCLINQEGVFRTNCLDCLDRTNVIQIKIAINVFEIIMNQLGIDLLAVFGKDPLSLLDNDNIKQQHPFIVAYKNVWADNGDYMSMHYAGTGSTTSNITRNGKQNIFGIFESMSKSFGRFYQSNFEDGLRQECIEILTGTHSDSLAYQTEYFDKALKKYEKLYTVSNDITVFISSWNLGAYEPNEKLDMTEFFAFESGKSPDIIVFGCQEFVDLNALNMMSNDQSKSKIWIDFIDQALKMYGKYTYVRSQTLVGLLLIIFAKDTLWNRISKIDADVVKTGLAGTVGNKGAVVIKFNIDDTSFVFVNVHMEAGGKATKERLANLTEFHNRAFQQHSVGKRKEEKIMALDIKFLFGDTNFRINHGNTEVKAMIDEYYKYKEAGKEEDARKIIKQLFDLDQLNVSKDHEIVKIYKEGEINFLPTYKYDANSNIYDSSAKKRTPSWTDRILWHENDAESVAQHFYTRREYKESDHRPVVSLFTVKTKTVNQEKRDIIIQSFSDKGFSLVKALKEKDAVFVPDLNLA